MSAVGLVLVTGASRGIGAATSVALARRGFDLALWARSRADLDRIAGVCSDLGASVQATCVDVAQPVAVEEAIRTLPTDQLRGLVVNAGMGVWGTLEELTPEDWRTQQAVNVDGAFYALRGCAARLRACPHAQVVAIASDSSLHGYPGRPGYCASKFGLVGLMESARRELRSHDVRITMLLASRVDTYFRGKQPGGRPEALSADEIGEMIGGLFDLPPRVEYREVHVSAITTTFGPYPEVAPGAAQ